MKRKPDELWIEHSCGTWKIGKGDQIGRVMLKTQSMGFTIGRRVPLNNGPNDVVAKLLKANPEIY